MQINIAFIVADYLASVAAISFIAHCCWNFGGGLRKNEDLPVWLCRHSRQNKSTRPISNIRRAHLVQKKLSGKFLERNLKK
jgi:hypothetical protein